MTIRMGMISVAISLALAGAASAQTAERSEWRSLHRSLRETINTGADLFNLQADYAGCYRLYQGCLVSLKPLMPAEIQNEIDVALAEAAGKSSTAEQAYRLRATIDSVRERIAPGPELIAIPPTRIAR